jgi:membrane-associated phospholipid phosphatase
MSLDFARSEWKEFVKSPAKVILLIFSFALMVLMLHLIASFICNIEHRQGFAFDDPLLSLFQPIDLTWLIFSVLYFSVIFVVIQLLSNPRKLILGFLSYSLLLSFRILAMYLLPLDPPKNIILLKDPLIEYFGTDVTLTRDLFFSGHTSLMVLLFLLSEGKVAKILLLCGVVVVGLGVMLQNVHYSVDVLVAIFAGYCSFAWTKAILSRFKIYPK